MSKLNEKTKRKCEICEEKTIKINTLSLECGHICCLSCFRSLIKNQIDNFKKEGFFCTICNFALDFKQIIEGLNSLNTDWFETHFYKCSICKDYKPKKIFERVKFNCNHFACISCLDKYALISLKNNYRSKLCPGDDCDTNINDFLEKTTLKCNNCGVKSQYINLAMMDCKHLICNNCFSKKKYTFKNKEKLVCIIKDCKNEKIPLKKKKSEYNYSNEKELENEIKNQSEIKEEKENKSEIKEKKQKISEIIEEKQIKSEIKCIDNFKIDENENLPQNEENKTNYYLNENYLQHKYNNNITENHQNNSKLDEIQKKKKYSDENEENKTNDYINKNYFGYEFNNNNNIDNYQNNSKLDEIKKKKKYSYEKLDSEATRAKSIKSLDIYKNEAFEKENNNNEANDKINEINVIYSNNKKYCINCNNEENIIKLDCNHEFCKFCIIKEWKGKIDMEIEEDESNILKCSACYKEIDLNLLKQNLGTELFEKYDNILLKKFRKNIITKQCPDCEKIMETSEEYSYFYCFNCKNQYCINCNVNWEKHKDFSCKKNKIKKREHVNYCSHCKTSHNFEYEHFIYRICPFTNIYICKICETFLASSDYIESHYNVEGF